MPSSSKDGAGTPRTCSSKNARTHRVITSHMRRPSMLAWPMRPTDQRRSDSSRQSMNVRCSAPRICAQYPGRAVATRCSHADRCSAAVLLAPFHRREHLLTHGLRGGLHHLRMLGEHEERGLVDGAALGFTPQHAVQVDARPNPGVRLRGDHGSSATEGVSEHAHLLGVDPGTEPLEPHIGARYLIERRTQVVGLHVDDVTTLADVHRVRSLGHGERAGDGCVPEPAPSAVAEVRGRDHLVRVLQADDDVSVARELLERCSVEVRWPSSGREEHERMARVSPGANGARSTECVTMLRLGTPQSTPCSHHPCGRYGAACPMVARSAGYQMVAVNSSRRAAPACVRVHTRTIDPVDGAPPDCERPRGPRQLHRRVTLRGSRARRPREDWQPGTRIDESRHRESSQLTGSPGSPRAHETRQRRTP